MERRGEVDFTQLPDTRQGRESEQIICPIGLCDTGRTDRGYYYLIVRTSVGGFKGLFYLTCQMVVRELGWEKEDVIPLACTPYPLGKRTMHARR